MAGAHSRSIAWLVDPALQGGTSAAVAAELQALDGWPARRRVHEMRTRMGGGRPPAPVLADALDRLGLPLRPAQGTVAADLVILHNPALLKFEAALPFRIVARDLFVVLHENPTRPGGAEGFDLDHALTLLERFSFTGRRWLAPISARNRASLGAVPPGWRVTAEDWFNICDFPLLPASTRPADRRGRHSRPGPEKFPPLATLDRLFPPTAGANVLLGADPLMKAAEERQHWQVHPFRGLLLDRYFQMIDFQVHFTAPTWAESFGRALAEGIAAGKVVISDPETAAGFAGGVIGARPDEVDAVIAAHVADPARYAAQVARGQQALRAFSASAFRDRFARLSAPRPELERAA